MIKVVTLLFKKPGLSKDEFRDYYENHHRQLGEKYLAPHALRYVRRYPILAGDGADDSEFDVMMEVWFENYHAMESAMGEMTTEIAQAELSEDEEKLFDRDRTQSFIVDECESDLDEAEADRDREAL